MYTIRYVCTYHERSSNFVLNDDDVRGNVRALTYRERPKRPILNKTVRAARTRFIFMKAHRLGLCTETLLLIYGGRATLFQFNFPVDAQRAAAISAYIRKSSAPLFGDKSYIFVLSPISPCQYNYVIHITKQLTKYDVLYRKWFVRTFLVIEIKDYFIIFLISINKARCIISKVYYIDVLYRFVSTSSL